MALFKVALTVLAMFVFASDAFANRTFLDFDLRALEGFKENTTQAMAKAIENQVLRQCRAISSFDKIEIVSEQVTDRMEQQQWATEAAKCDLDLPGCSGASYPVGKPTVFRSFDLVLRRTDSNNQFSYTIKISTNWDQDLPMPQANVQVIQSEYCKWRAL